MIAFLGRHFVPACGGQGGPTPADGPLPDHKKPTRDLRRVIDIRFCFAWCLGVAGFTLDWASSDTGVAPFCGYHFAGQCCDPAVSVIVSTDRQRLADVQTAGCAALYRPGRGCAACGADPAPAGQCVYRCATGLHLCCRCCPDRATLASGLKVHL